MFVTTLILMAGISKGSVILENRCHLPAPSIVAASTYSEGIDWSPAK